MNATMDLPTPDFRVLFESVPGLYLVLTPDFRIVGASDAYLRATMTSRAAIVGRHLFEVFPDNPDDPTATGVRNLSASLNRVLQNRVPDAMAVQKYDIRRPEAEGGAFEERYWSPVNSPVFGDGGAVAYIIHRVEDVTEFVRLKQEGAEQLKANEELRSRAEKMEAEVFLRAQEVARAHNRAEEVLGQSEERFRLLIEGVRDYAIFMLDPEGRVASWNAGAEHIKGYAAAEIIGEHFSRFFLAEDLQKAKPEEELRIATVEGRCEDEGWRVRKDGSRFWADVIITALHDNAGNLKGFSKITRDLTEWKRVEEALRESEERTRLIVETANEAFIAMNAAGVITAWNAQAEATFGWTRAEAVGRQLAQTIIPPQYREAHYRGLQRFLATGEGPVLNRRIEITALHRDGREFPVEMTISPLRVAGTAVFNAFVHDITARKKIEQRAATFAQQLQRSNQELEQFASIVSHDLQEPLRKIQVFGERLKTRCAEALGAQGRDYLQRMQASATRMRTFINDLLALSRVMTKAQSFKPVDLAQVAREVVSDLEGRIHATGGRVTMADLPTVEADPTQMRQLLQNLIGNSLKFHRPGVPPVVSVEGKLLAGTEVALSPSTRVCQIAVRDNGIGFEEEYADRIFEVFQRLHGRDEYEGSGMGLAICRKIIERHDGTITARSAPAEGATFLVTIPVSQPNKEKDHEEASQAGHHSDGR